jgi:ribosomal protein S18 acetylase RimI-like enzyme
MLATLSLRTLRATDRGDVVRLLATAGNFNAAEQAVGAEVLDDALADPGRDDYRFVIAEEGGRVVGYACWGLAALSDGTWDLYWIAVDPSCRGRGVGTGLLDHVEERVRADAGRLLLAETSSRPGYENTLAFYAARGYETLARFRDFYSVGDDKVVFGKSFPR